MKKIPIKIKQQIKNAYYYLECADNFPPPTKNAVHILLLLIGWENIITADEELGAWINKTKVDSKLYKSHLHKFRKAPSIEHIILGSGKVKTVTVVYSSPNELKKLREYCQYGFAEKSKDVARAFGSTWCADTFRNKLYSKIQWTDGLVSAIESLE